MTPLQQAVKHAIAVKNIDFIYEAMKACPLYVFGKDTGNGAPALFLTQAAGKSALCITATDTLPLLTKIPTVTPIPMTGSELLKCAGVHEIMLVFDDGGYYLDRAQLDWFTQLAAGTAP